MDNYVYNFSVQYGDVGENNSLTNKGFLRFLQEAAGLASSEVGMRLK